MQDNNDLMNRYYNDAAHVLAGRWRPFIEAYTGGGHGVSQGLGKARSRQA